MAVSTSNSGGCTIPYFMSDRPTQRIIDASRNIEENDMRRCLIVKAGITVTLTLPNHVIDGFFRIYVPYNSSVTFSTGGLTKIDTGEALEDTVLYNGGYYELTSVYNETESNFIWVNTTDRMGSMLDLPYFNFQYTILLPYVITAADNNKLLLCSSSGPITDSGALSNEFRVKISISSGYDLIFTSALPIVDCDGVTKTPVILRHNVEILKRADHFRVISNRELGSVFYDAGMGPAPLHYYNKDKRAVLHKDQIYGITNADFNVGDKIQFINRESTTLEERINLLFNAAVTIYDLYLGQFYVGVTTHSIHCDCWGFLEKTAATEWDIIYFVSTTNNSISLNDLNNVADTFTGLSTNSLLVCDDPLNNTWNARELQLEQLSNVSASPSVTGPVLFWEASTSSWNCKSPIIKFTNIVTPINPVNYGLNQMVYGGSVVYDTGGNQRLFMVISGVSGDWRQLCSSKTLTEFNNNEVLVYDSALHSFAPYEFKLDNLSDVILTPPLVGFEFLGYNGANWVNMNPDIYYIATTNGMRGDEIQVCGDVGDLLRERAKLIANNWSLPLSQYTFDNGYCNGTFVYDALNGRLAVVVDNNSFATPAAKWKMLMTTTTTTPNLMNDGVYKYNSSGFDLLNVFIDASPMLKSVFVYDPAYILGGAYVSRQMLLGDLADVYKDNSTLAIDIHTDLNGNQYFIFGRNNTITLDATCTNCNVVIIGENNNLGTHSNLNATSLGLILFKVFGNNNVWGNTTQSYTYAQWFCDGNWNTVNSHNFDGLGLSYGGRSFIITGSSTYNPVIGTRNILASGNQMNWLCRTGSTIITANEQYSTTGSAIVYIHYSPATDGHYGKFHTISSSQRYKTKLADVSDTDTQWFKELQYVYYRFNSDTTNQPYLGLFAEELASKLDTYAPAIKNSLIKYEEIEGVQQISSFDWTFFTLLVSHCVSTLQKYMDWGSGKIKLSNLTSEPANGTTDLRISSTTGELIRQSSAARWKKNITDMSLTDAEYLLEVTAKWYNYISQGDGEPKQAGFIADDFVAHMNNLVSYEGELVDSLDYSRICAYLQRLLAYDHPLIKQLNDFVYVTEDETGSKLHFKNIDLETGTSGYSLKLNVSTGEVYADASSLQVKTNLEVINYEQVKPLLNIKPVRFHYKNNTKINKTVGLIAEELDAKGPVLNAAIIRHNGEVVGLDYEKLIPMMLTIISHQQLEIDELRRNVQELQTQPLVVRRVTATPLSGTPSSVLKK